MQQTPSKGNTKRRGTNGIKTFKVTIGDHTMPLTASQLLADKSGWTPCHGKVGDDEVHSLGFKRIGDKIAVKDGQGKLAGCYDANEFAVMAKTFMISIDADSISIGSTA